VSAYRTALELDIAMLHPSSERREAAQRWCSLSTPILKAVFTQQAFHGASECLQVFGGHGYVRESGSEQHVRDARVTMIYEGSNEIQAIDLLVRKVLPDGALAFNLWLAELGADLDPAVQAQARLLSRLTSLREHTQRLLQAAAQDDTLAYWVAEDFLRAVGLTLVNWAWVQIGRGSQAAAPRWSAPAQAVQRWIMPELATRLAIIDAAVTPS
jgi:hypothetical protein